MRHLHFVLLFVAVTLIAFAAASLGGAAGGRSTTVAMATGPSCAPARPHASGTTGDSVMTTFGTRFYRIHVPPSYSGTTPVPLVLDIHGLGSSSSEQEAYSQFDPKSDAGGFIVVYPEGVSTTLISSSHFNAWQLPSPEPDDVGFMSAILDKVAGQLCIDQTRVDSTGMSNGGIMSVRLACSLSRRIAAIAPVAESYFPPMSLNLNPGENCPDATAVPTMAFHGTADTTVPFNGGPGTNGLNFRLPQDDNTPAEDVLSDWAMHDGCAGSRMESQVSSEVRLIQYGSCANGAIAELYAVDGGGHTWPGSPFDVPSLGYTTHQISATDLIWSFFSGYSLPDADADLLPDGNDNCPSVANFDQADTDGDGLGDACETPSGYGTDPNNADTDGDGCKDGHELLTAIYKHQQGGDRDPLNPWDFFDVPVPVLLPSSTTGTRNKAVSISDVIAIVSYIGTFDGGAANANGASYNSDLDGDGVADGREYDRAPSADMSKPWRSGAPTGAVTIADALVALNQVGDNCN